MRKKCNWWQYKNVFKTASHWFFFMNFELPHKIKFIAICDSFLFLLPLEVLRENIRMMGSLSRRKVLGILGSWEGWQLGVTLNEGLVNCGWPNPPYPPHLLNFTQRTAPRDGAVNLNVRGLSSWMYEWKCVSALFHLCLHLCLCKCLGKCRVE